MAGGGVREGACHGEGHGHAAPGSIGRCPHMQVEGDDRHPAVARTHQAMRWRGVDKKRELGCVGQGTFQSNDMPEKASSSQFTRPFLIALL